MHETHLKYDHLLKKVESLEAQSDHTTELHKTTMAYLDQVQNQITA
jgi:Mg2+ and Co2+ transporter CorA